MLQLPKTSQQWFSYPNQRRLLLHSKKMAVNSCGRYLTGQVRRLAYRLETLWIMRMQNKTVLGIQNWFRMKSQFIEKEMGVFAEISFYSEIWTTLAGVFQKALMWESDYQPVRIEDSRCFSKGSHVGEWLSACAYRGFQVFFKRLSCGRVIISLCL